MNRTLSLATLSLALASCHGYIAVGPSTTVLYESEPNDSVFSPDTIGTLFANEKLLIKGDIGYGFDQYDGFAFQVSAPCTIEFSLVSHNGADLDLTVVDPFWLIETAKFQSPFNPETGEFSIVPPFDNPNFHLVVSSFSGPSSYSLEVRTHGTFLATASDGGAEGAPEAAIDAEGKQGQFDDYLRSDAAAESDDTIPVEIGLLVEFDADGNAVDIQRIAASENGILALDD